MSKELQQRISQLEEELSKLKKEVESSKKEPSSLLVPWDGEQNYEFYIENVDHPGFSSIEEYNSWSSALDTFFKLRYQEGSEVVKDDVVQYSIDIEEDYILVINVTTTDYYKLNQISPMFSSEELAQKAIDEVGKENIIAMFKTFHGL